MKFWLKCPFCEYSGTINAIGANFGLIGLIFESDQLENILRFLEHPNMRLPFKFIAQN
jgi:hypothetical protein